MEVRHRLRLLTALTVAAAMALAALPQGSPAEPASVAVESVGLARQAGCAVVHVATSSPTRVRIERTSSGRLVAEFLNAVLAPQAAGAFRQTPALGTAFTMEQESLDPPVVRLRATSLDGEPPVVERFADGRGLLVRLSVPAEVAQAPSPAPVEALPALARPLMALAREVTARSAALSPIRLSLPLATAPLGAPAPRQASATVPQLPIAAVAARPEPRDEPATLLRVRVVELAPLQVAIDCSRELEHEVEHQETPPAYAVSFPGARLDAGCERTIALHPTAEAHVTVEETDSGATVTIPAGPSDTCEVGAGASAATVICRLVAQAEPSISTDLTVTQPTDLEDDPIVNLDFQEAPVVEILTALAKYAGRNIMTTTAVSGTMSVHLSDVTLTQALDVVTMLNELDYALIGERNYVVGTAEEVQRFKDSGTAVEPGELQFTYAPTATTPERIAREMREIVEKVGVTIKIVEDAKSMVFMEVPDQATAAQLREMASTLDVPPVETVRWVQLEHITPQAAKAALEGLVTDVDIRVPGAEGPQVGVVGLGGKTVDVDKAEALLVQLDVEPTADERLPGRGFVTRTLELSYVDPDETVKIIQGMFGDKIEAFAATPKEQLQDAQDTEQAGGLRPPARIVVRGPADLVAQVEEFIVVLDSAPPQVEITATITDVRVDKDSKVGFEWDLPGLTISERQTAGDGFKFGKIIRSPMNATGAGAMTSTFEAAVTDTNTTVLSRTTLRALQGKTANFLVGDIIPYEITIAGDGTVSRSVEFQEIGLGLKFSPTVDSQGRISVYLEPHVRSFTGFSPQGYPIVATREAKTIVQVRDGDMVAIGGLLRDEEIRTLSGIPFLKDIPLFGELFRKRQLQKKKSEVVVFAEIKLVRPEALAATGAAEVTAEG
jgi:type II secretory pathway component GspD/PulD (secretin)